MSTSTRTQRILLAATAAVVLAVVSTACNNTDIKNRTIPPIAGVTVGGPTAQDGNGNVGVAVNEAEAEVVPGSTIQVLNVTRNVSSSVEAAASPVPTVVPVQGDVGDTIRVTLQVQNFGSGSHDYDVPSPAITDVSSGAGADGAVLVGQHALITGEGFCHDVTAETVFIDGTALEPSALGDGTPTSLGFVVPATLSTAFTHTLQLTVAGAGTDVPKYASQPVTITASHAP